jgi:hypothetical protein
MKLEINIARENASVCHFFLIYSIDADDFPRL